MGTLLLPPLILFSPFLPTPSQCKYAPDAPAANGVLVVNCRVIHSLGETYQHTVQHPYNNLIRSRDRQPINAIDKKTGQPPPPKLHLSTHSYSQP
jgi:hypothetical protein